MERFDDIAYLINHLLVPDTVIEIVKYKTPPGKKIAFIPYVGPTHVEKIYPSKLRILLCVSWIKRALTHHRLNHFRGVL